MPAPYCEAYRAHHGVPGDAAPRGALLRWIDAFAEWKMRDSMRAIGRAQARGACRSSVVQPSSRNERSSTSPCER